MATRYGYSGDSRTEAQKQKDAYVAQRISPTSNIGSKGHTGSLSTKTYNPRTDPRSTVGTQENPGVIIKRPITVTDSQGNNKTVMQPVDRLMRVQVKEKSGATRTVWVTQDVYNDPSPAGRAVMNRLSTEQAKGISTKEYRETYPENKVNTVINTTTTGDAFGFTPTPANPAGDKFKVNDPAGFYGSQPKEEGAVFFNGMRVRTIAEYERQLKTNTLPEDRLNKNIIANLQTLHANPRAALQEYFITGAYNFKENSGVDKSQVRQSIITGEYNTPSKELNAYIVKQKENTGTAPPEGFGSYQYFMASKKQQQIENQIFRNDYKKDQHTQNFINVIKTQSSGQSINPYDYNTLKTTTLNSTKPTAIETLNQASLVTEYYGLSAFKGMAIIPATMAYSAAKTTYNTGSTLIYNPVGAAEAVLSGKVAKAITTPFINVGYNLASSTYNAGYKIATGTVTDRDLFRFSGKVIEFESAAASFGAVKNLIQTGATGYKQYQAYKLSSQEARLADAEAQLKEGYNFGSIKTKQGFTLRPETEINIYDNGMYANVKTGKFAYRIGGKEPMLGQVKLSDFNFKYESTIKFHGAEVRINTVEWAASDKALMAEKIAEPIERYSNIKQLAELDYARTYNYLATTDRLALLDKNVMTGDLYGVPGYGKAANIAGNAQAFLRNINPNVMTGDLYGVPGFGKAPAKIIPESLDSFRYSITQPAESFNLIRPPLGMPVAKDVMVLSSNGGVMVKDTLMSPLLSEAQVNIPKGTFSYGIPPLLAAVKPATFAVAPLAFDTYNIVGHTLALGMFSGIGQGERIDTAVNKRTTAFESNLNKIAPIQTPQQFKLNYSIVNQPITDTGVDLGLGIGTGVITGLGTIAGTTIITKTIYQTITNNIYEKEIIKETETIREYLPPEPNFYGSGGLFHQPSFKQLFKRVTTKYTPSVAAILYDIHGKVRGGKYSGAELRPLPEERKHRRKAKGKRHK